MREVVAFDDFAIFTHDRGVSVGLAFLGHYLDEDRPYTINYHFLSNSGMFLPLANLVPGQRVLLDPVRGPVAIAELKSRPRQTDGDPVGLAYADMQAFNDGIGARLHVGKYLLERMANEYRWLDNLPRSPIPVAYVWGALDPVNPLRIANHVWARYLNEREAESSFWVLPTASHYPQRDRPAELARIVKLALSGSVPSREDGDDFMLTWNRQRTEHDAIFVGHSIIEEMEFEGAVEYTPQGYVPVGYSSSEKSMTKSNRDIRKILLGHRLTKEYDGIEGFLGESYCEDIFGMCKSPKGTKGHGWIYW